MECPRCGSNHITLNGKRHDKVQGYKCSDCRKQFCERTGTFFYRYRFPELAIKIAILLNLFISSKIVELLMYIIFRVRVSNKTVCCWTRRFLDLLPDIYQKHYPKKLFLICYSDEKFIKVKKSKDKFAYWWSIADCFGNLIATIITESRDLESAKKLFRKAKESIDKKVDMLVRDGLQAYDKAGKIFGRQCKNVIAGIKGKFVMNEKDLLYITNNPAESKNAEIDYFMKRFRDCFENIESANRWRKAFMFTTHLQKCFATQKHLEASPVGKTLLDWAGLPALQV